MRGFVNKIVYSKDTYDRIKISAIKFYFFNYYKNKLITFNFYNNKYI